MLHHYWYFLGYRRIFTHLITDVVPGTNNYEDIINTNTWREKIDLGLLGRNMDEGRISYPSKTISSTHFQLPVSKREKKIVFQNMVYLPDQTKNSSFCPIKVQFK